jgi:putative glutamine amidotransferase
MVYAEQVSNHLERKERKRYIMTLPIYLSDPSGLAGRSQKDHDYITKHMHDTVSKAVEAAGFTASKNAVPDMLPSDGSMEGFGGLILFGGYDIDSRYYKGGWRTNKANEKDAYELNLIYAAMKAGLPILGICRGMQLINTAFGGTLHGDIAHLTDHPHNNFGAGAYEHRAIAHDVTVLDSSVLRNGTYSVASSHHQAVKDVGEGLTVTALSHDGLIEMIEAPELNVIGTQWHPEASHVNQDDTLTPLLENFFQHVRAQHQESVEGLPSILSASDLLGRFPVLGGDVQSTYQGYGRYSTHGGSEGYNVYQGTTRTYIPAWQWDDEDVDSRGERILDRHMFLDEDDFGLLSDAEEEDLRFQADDVEAMLEMDRIRETW